MGYSYTYRQIRNIVLCNTGVIKSYIEVIKSYLVNQSYVGVIKFYKGLVSLNSYAGDA